LCSGLIVGSGECWWVLLSVFLCVLVRFLFVEGRVFVLMDVLFCRSLVSPISAFVLRVLSRTDS